MENMEMAFIFARKYWALRLFAMDSKLNRIICMFLQFHSERIWLIFIKRSRAELLIYPLIHSKFNAAVINSYFFVLLFTLFIKMSCLFFDFMFNSNTHLEHFRGNNQTYIAFIWRVSNSTSFCYEWFSDVFFCTLMMTNKQNIKNKY